jgi:tetratricopeptide (TPR) repeat protein
MLTYALARSGDPAGAKAEVERLAAMPRQHPLLPLLRGYAGRARPAAKTDATNGDAGVVDGGAAAIGIDAGRAAGERTDRADRGDKSHVPIDARQLVSQGEAARSRGDYERAQTLFAAALDRNPNDTEALNGLAAIAHARHDLIGARASYKRVLSVNPSYIPALVGLGDVDWESGDRTSAMKTYKEIVDRFPDGAYPARIRRRLEPAPAPAPATSPEPSHEPASGEPGGGG